MPNKRHDKSYEGSSSQQKRVKFSGDNEYYGAKGRESDNEDDDEGYVQFMKESLDNKKNKRGIKLEGYESDEDIEEATEEAEPEIKSKGLIDDDESDGQESDPEEQETSFKGFNDGDAPSALKSVPIEPFNMKRELEEGRFEEGMYIKSKDEDAIHDNWLTGISSKDIAKAAEAKRQREQKVKDNETQKDHKRNKYDLMKGLLNYIQPGETLVQTMQRLRGPTIAHSGSKRKHTSQNADAIIKLTEMADELIACGLLTIYEETFEELEYELIQKGLIKKRQPPMFEYKWEEQGEIFGPFSLEQMKAWSGQGFFQNNIFIRQVEAKEDGSYQPLTQFSILTDQLS